jgi:hypothetical protein
MNPKDVAKLSPERQRIAKIFKTHIDRAVEELGVGYEVTLQGRYDKTPIRIEIEVTSKEEIDEVVLCRITIKANQENVK